MEVLKIWCALIRLVPSVVLICYYRLEYALSGEVTNLLKYTLPKYTLERTITIGHITRSISNGCLTTV